MDAVAFGNEDQAQRILEVNHDLLNDKSVVATDYSGKMIRGLTPFQAALCAGDVEMCQMMKPYFERFEGGQVLMQKQFDAIFPQGIVSHAKDQKEAVFDFSYVIGAILSAPAEDVQKALYKQFDINLPLHKALDTFRVQFSKVSLNEQVFNPQHFIEALRLYYATFDGADSWNKRDLIWRQMVGYTQRFFSACWAQAAAGGVYDIVEDNEKLQRHFNFSDSQGAFFPLADSDGVGFDFAAGRAAGRPRERHLIATLGRRRHSYVKLYGAKTSSLEKLLHRSNIIQRHDAYK